jgi:hypothetical protein
MNTDMIRVWICGRISRAICVWSMKFGLTIESMVIEMNEERPSLVAELRAFLDGTGAMRFEAPDAYSGLVV